MTRARRRVVREFERRRVFDFLLAVGLLVGLAGAGTSQASIPPSSSVTVPTSTGQAVTDTWTGAIPPGTNATSDCSPFVENFTLADQHSVTVIVPAGTHDAVQANLTFNITWPDA